MAHRRVSARRARIRRERLLVALPFGAAVLSLFLAPLAALARQTANAVIDQPLWAVLAGVALILVVAGAVLFKAPRRSAWPFRGAQTLGALRALTPTRFELAVGDLLAARGYRDVRHTGGAGDLAADLTCHDARGARVVVQCKRYRAGCPVTSPEMQQFIGMIYTHHHADYGIYVTTSTFTRPASALAQQHGIRLVDGDALAVWLRAQRHAHAAPALPSANFQRILSAE